jgi:uncharacterized membrane protein HdeD (DUF308 family)
MPSKPDNKKPPSRGARVAKAAIPFALGIKLFTTASPSHGPAFTIFGVLMVLGGVISVIYALVAPVK